MKYDIAFCSSQLQRPYEMTVDQMQSLLKDDKQANFVVFEKGSLLFFQPSKEQNVCDSSLFHQLTSLSINTLYESEQLFYLGQLGQKQIYAIIIEIPEMLKDKLVHFYNIQYSNMEDSQVVGVAYTIVNHITSTIYCTKCGQQLVFINPQRSYKKCQTCSLEYYPIIQPSIIVRIVFNDKMLFCLRRGNMYTHVAGFVEPVETAEQTVYRELAEEIGVQKHQIKKLTALQFQQPWPARFSSYMLSYEVQLFEQIETICSSEVKKTFWAGKQEYILAASRIDSGDEKGENGWVVPNKKTVARLMMDDFFEFL